MSAVNYENCLNEPNVINYFDVTIFLCSRLSNHSLYFRLDSWAILHDCRDVTWAEHV